MTQVDWARIEPLLMQVEKPARYVGGEFNQVVRPDARVRACLAFPDLYELGMSYHGYRLLYERINAVEGWAAERAFTPWPDMEKAMRAAGLPLWSLETRRPLAEFDWIGLTLQHEVNYTNILTLIDLAGLPLESRERTAVFPLVVGGGEGAFSPEPLAPFIDVFVVGDGEEAVIELMEHCERARAEGWDRARLLLALAGRPGFYVPAFYEPRYHEDGTVAAVELRAEARGHAPERVYKRHYNLAQDLGSVAPVVPLLRTVHDRLAIEIRRGCVNGCRFCQAGMITRPVNERPPGQIVEIARRGLEASGYDEISLLSLSSADHSCVRPLARALTERFGPRGVSISLPSLRINGFDVELVDELASVRKGGITFAPEAGSERLRKVINKPVDQEYFLQTIDDVFRRGWRTVKLYFMIGLPTETDEDLEGIVELCEQTGRIGRRHHGRQARINVTLSPFVPKSNTPFQWEAQPPREELRRRFEFVRERVRRRCGGAVDVKTSDLGQLFIEAVLARGDRRMATALRRAWELGARFDGWHEHFSLERWLAAFAAVGLDPAFYANRERGEHEVLPHEHIEAGPGRRFLWADRLLALAERHVEKCDTGACAGCDACDDDQIVHTLASDMTEMPTEAIEPPKLEGAVAGDNDGELAPVQRLRLDYSRQESLRYLSHLDFIKVLGVVLRRARLPLAWSQGFNPQPKVQFAPPLSLGMGGAAELLDIMLVRPLTPMAALKRLNGVGLPGLQFIACEEVELRAPGLEASLSHADYRLFLRPGADDAGTDDAEAALGRFLAAESFPIEIERKKGTRTLDLRQSLARAELVSEPGQAGADHLIFELSIALDQGAFVKPHEALGAMLGRKLTLGHDVRVDRLGFSKRLPAPAAA